MEQIILRRLNVIRIVDSEDRAKRLEAAGFVRESREAALPPLPSFEDAESHEETKTLRSPAGKAPKMGGRRK